MLSLINLWSRFVLVQYIFYTSCLSMYFGMLLLHTDSESLYVLGHALGHIVWDVCPVHGICKQQTDRLFSSVIEYVRDTRILTTRRRSLSLALCEAHR